MLLSFFYRFIKSGLTFDFFFKKIVHTFLSFNFIIFNILLSEKYFVEQLFVKGFTTLKWFWRFFNLYSNEFTLSNLSLLLLIFIVVIVFIDDRFTWLFTSIRWVFIYKNFKSLSFIFFSYTYFYSSYRDTVFYKFTCFTTT
jgi:hypothetical protein